MTRSGWLRLAASSTVVVGCTSLAGLDGDYTLGDPHAVGGGPGSGAAGPASATVASVASVGGSDAGGSHQAGAGAGGSPPLLDDAGLMARYFLDEMASGPAAGPVNDASGNGYHLTLDPGAANVEWQVLAGQRGLYFATPCGSGQAFADVTGMPVAAAFDQQRDATVEAVVANIVGSASGNGRIMAFGDAGTLDTLSFGMNLGAIAEIRFNGTDKGQFPLAALATDERVVVHAVIDTTLAAPEQRTRVFVNGAEIAASSLTATQNEAFSLQATMYLVVGNRRLDDRSFGGNLMYVALYDAAFEPGRVASHAAILLQSDDAP